MNEIKEIEGKLMKCKRCHAQMFVIESPGFHTAQCPSCGQEFQVGSGFHLWWGKIPKIPQPLIYPIPEIHLAKETEGKQKRGKWEAVKV